MQFNVGKQYYVIINTSQLENISISPQHIRYRNELATFRSSADCCSSLQCSIEFIRLEQSLEPQTPSSPSTPPLFFHSPFLHLLSFRFSSPSLVLGKLQQTTKEQNEKISEFRALSTDPLMTYKETISQSPLAA